MESNKERWAGWEKDFGASIKFKIFWLLKKSNSDRDVLLIGFIVLSRKEKLKKSIKKSLYLQFLHKNRCVSIAGGIE